MADLTIQDVVEAGLQVAYAAADPAGDAVLNVDGDVFLHVLNADAGQIVVTVTAQDASEEVPGFGAMTKADAQVTVTAGEERFIGPFPKRAFNDGTNRIQIAYSSVTNVSVAALRLRRAA